MKHTKRVMAFALALFLVITMFPMTQTNVNAAAKTKLNKTKATVYVGKTVKLKLKNKHTKKKVKWKSTNKKVASVSKKGKVKGKKPGKATVIAKVGNKKYKCKITVKKKAANTPTTKSVEATKPAATTEKSQITTAANTAEPEATSKEAQITIPNDTAEPVVTTKNEAVIPQTTIKLPEETTTAIKFTTDSTIEKPFGVVVSSPENGMVSVVWGAGKINCYNLYIDGERRRTGVAAANFVLPVYTEGTHTIAITTVVGMRESEKVETTITVVGVGERETEPETCPEELKPQLDKNLALKNDKVLMQLNNKTNGKYADNQIYWCIVGYNTSKQLCYMDKNGNLIPANTSMNNLTVNNRAVANVCHTLSEANHVYVPTIESGRMYLSYGKPIYLTFNKAGDGSVGYAGPDLNNSSDPNVDTLFEFAEFTVDGKSYWGNTTRVDFFSFPMITRLVGHTQYATYDKTVGDMGTRDEIFASFKNNAPEAFKTLVNDKRIMAPCKATFNEGQKYSNYFDSYINEFWTKYTKENLVFQCEGGTFTGRVEGNRMKFTKNGESTAYYVNKPTTQDVLEGRGAFNNGNGTEKVIEAQLCAAFNRGVAMEPSKWTKPAEYYKNSINNYYAGFFHEHSVVGLAYGFCYDDVNDQSTLLQYDHADALIIDLRW